MPAAVIQSRILDSGQAGGGSNYTFGDWRATDHAEAYIIEAWGQGFMLGALLIMCVTTIVNMRRNVLLHKLILLELILAMSHGTFCLMSFNNYEWYLSSTAALLYCSYFTHNVVAWVKISPFFSGSQVYFSPTVCKYVKWIYLTTLAMSAPVLIFQIYNNFRFFNRTSRFYERVRPYEPLLRDPWWIFSSLTLVYVIQKCYSLRLMKVVVQDPRFAILFASVFISLVFTVMDILASILPSLSVTYGINPYWKLALVFRCLTDNIVLDNFKSSLRRLLEESTAAQHTMNIYLNTDQCD